MAVISDVSTRLRAAWERREATEDAFVERARQSYAEDFAKDRKWRKTISVSPLVQAKVERQKKWLELFGAHFFLHSLGGRLEIVRAENKQVSVCRDIRRKYEASTTEEQRTQAWTRWKLAINVVRCQTRLMRKRNINRAVFVMRSFLTQAIKLSELKSNCFRLIYRVTKLQRLCRNFTRLKKLRVEQMVLEWRKHEETILKRYYQDLLHAQASAAVTARVWRSKRVSETSLRETLHDVYVNRARRFGNETRKWRLEVREHFKYEVDVRKFIQTLQRRVAVSKPKIFDESPNVKFWELTEREWRDLILRHVRLSDDLQLPAMS